MQGLRARIPRSGYERAAVRAFVIASALHALPPVAAPCFDAEAAFESIIQRHLKRAGYIGVRDEIAFDPARLEIPRCMQPPVWSPRARQAAGALP